MTLTFQPVKPLFSLSPSSIKHVSSKFSFTLTMFFTFKVETSTPSSGLNQDEQSHGIHKNGHDTSRESRGNSISISTFTTQAFNGSTLTAHILSWPILTCAFFLCNAEVCGFCRKPVALSEPAIEALNRTYHDGCFQCRSCHIPLAGKQYYNKAGIPLCADCYQVKWIQPPLHDVIEAANANLCKGPYRCFLWTNLLEIMHALD